MSNITRTRTIISAIANIAWSDGRLLPDEATFYAEVVDGLSLDVEESERVWRTLVQAAHHPEQVDVARLTEDDHAHLLKVAYEMAKSDGEVAQKELDAIRALAAECGITWRDAQEMIGHQR